MAGHRRGTGRPKQARAHIGGERPWPTSSPRAGSSTDPTSNLNQKMTIRHGKEALDEY